MYTRRQIIDMALSLPGAIGDTPFESDPESVIFRHGAGGKWFGALLRAPRRAVGLPGEGTAEVLDLKCDPLVAYGMRQTYPDIVPGYHMNKQHWITVRLEGALPEETLRMLLHMSWELTLKKRRRPQI